MPEGKKRVISTAVLASTESLAQFITRRLLEGLAVRVVINDKACEGYVCKLEFVRGNDYVFANVCVPDPDNEEETIDVRVAINTDGTVIIMPNQPET